MKLRVFTTSRQIRHFLQKQPDGMVDKVMSIGEFFSKAIIVPGKKFIDEDLKKIFLYEALHSIDAAKLGLPKDFVKFFKNADFVLDFFSEFSKEGVGIDELQLQDTYAEYGEHLALLQELLQVYEEKLQAHGFADVKLVRDFEINENFIKHFNTIELEVAGYLSRFERSVLELIEKPIELRFWVSRYNRPLIQKMFSKEFDDGFYRYDFHSVEVLEHLPLKKYENVEVAGFSDRIFQVHYALASIQEFVERGCEPQNIAVIVPDESFVEYLELFNNGNLNFAMGHSFVHSHIYRLLEAIYKSEEDELAKERAQEYLDKFAKSDLLKFIKNHATSKEMMVIEEELYKLSKILPHIQEDRQLHFVLDRFSRLSFDDVNGGKVTVMGVLEARGMEFDGVIVVDFNEGVVPNVGQNDLFLNSLVRKRAGLPTRNEKEALQKHYYDRLFSSAKFVRIAYVENEEQMPSRFLYELGLKEGKRGDEVYEEVLFSFSKDPNPQDYSGVAIQRLESLTPTSMQMLLDCPLRYYFAYELGLSNEEEDEEFIFGLAFHKAVEKVLDTGMPPNWQEYYHKVMEQLLQGRNVDERFEILAKRAEGIEWFCREDFLHLHEIDRLEHRAKESKELDGFLLEARPDRLGEEYVFDYKTGSYKDGDRLQALFYAYLFDKEPLFYYLKEKKVRTLKDFEIDDPKQELKELLQSLEFTTRYAEDVKKCQWCPYTFICHRVL